MKRKYMDYLSPRQRKILADYYRDPDNRKRQIERNRLARSMGRAMANYVDEIVLQKIMESS